MPPLYVSNFTSNLPSLLLWFSPMLPLLIFQFPQLQVIIIQSVTKGLISQLCHVLIHNLSCPKQKSFVANLSVDGNRQAW